MVDRILRVMLIGLFLLVQTKHSHHVCITLRIHLHVKFVRVDETLDTPKNVILLDSIIGTMHDCRSANVVGIRNVNTVLLNKKIMIFKSF